MKRKTNNVKEESKMDIDTVSLNERKILIPKSQKK